MTAPQLIQRRYVDFTGAPESMRAEFFELAADVDTARAQLGAAAAETQRAKQKGLLVAFVAALVASLLGYWRGRRSAEPRIRITEARK